MYTSKCCNRFQCLEDDSKFDPIRIDPLNCDGFGGRSSDELVSQASGIPVMGGVTGGKKIIVSGIPVMGGVTGGKKSGIPVMGGVAITGTKKMIVEKDVERKIVGRAAGNPTTGAGWGELFEKRPVSKRM